MNSKKRKAAVASLEDRTLFQAFTQSANAVSQLYTAAVQAQRRAEEAGARQALVSGAGGAAGARQRAGGSRGRCLRSCRSPAAASGSPLGRLGRAGQPRSSAEQRGSRESRLQARRPPAPSLQERVAQFVVKEYGNAGAVPTNVLMEVLRHELQVRRRRRPLVAAPSRCRLTSRLPVARSPVPAAV